MISELEKKIALRYLRPKRKEGFLKIISIFSFLGIALGVAVLIIVMSVMNGFRTELLSKILGFNAHIIVKPYDKPINFDDINKLNLPNLSKSIFSISGEGILINKKTTKGILVRGYKKEDISKIDVINEGIIKGSLDDFDSKSISIGRDLALNLDVSIGDEITLMSPSGISTIIGNLPKQETFLISSIFTSGLSDFDQNIILFFAENVGNPTLDIFMQYVTESGDVFNMMIFAIIVLLIPKTRRIGITLLILIVISTLLTGYIKCGVDRDRPDFEYLGVEFPVEISRDTFALFCEGGFDASFPSGHAARSMIFAIILGYALSERFPRGAYLIFIYPAMISLSRLYVLQQNCIRFLINQNPNSVKTELSINTIAKCSSS